MPDRQAVCRREASNKLKPFLDNLEKEIIRPDHENSISLSRVGRMGLEGAGCNKVPDRQAVWRRDDYLIGHRRWLAPLPLHILYQRHLSPQLSSQVHRKALLDGSRLKALLDGSSLKAILDGSSLKALLDGSSLKAILDGCSLKAILDEKSLVSSEQQRGVCRFWALTAPSPMRAV